MKKGKVILTLAGFGVVVSLFKIQSMYYHKQIEKLQSDLADMQIENQILQTDLKECKQIEDSIKAKHNEMLAKLLRDFQNFKKSN